MNLLFRTLLVFGFLPIGFVFLGSALFFLAWVFAQRSRYR